MKIFTRFICLLLLFTLTNAALAQTSIISPTGDGGFETGTTFAANGWTVANYTATNTNKWFVGTAGVPSAGTNAAYISNNATGTTLNYSTTASSRVMFYRDVTFPAGETQISLSFKVKLSGESNYDDLTVFIQNGATVPAVTQPSASASAAPTITGATALATISVVGSAYVTRTYTVTAAQAGNTSAATTRRLIFYWENDASGGTQPPAAIDEISLTSSCLSVVPSAATLLTTTSAQANWATLAGTAQYEVRYKATTDPTTVSTWTTPITSATTNAAITGLSSSTAYEYQVRSATSGTCMTWSNSINFATLCNSVNLNLLQEFESGTTTPICWSQQFVSGTKAFSYGTATSAAGTSPNPAAYAGNNRLLFPSYSTSGNQTRLVTPVINTVGTSSVDVNFQWYHSSLGGATSYLTEGVKVQYSLDGTTWTNAGSLIKRYDATTAWTLKTLTLPAAAGNVATLYVGFLFTSNAGYDSYMDNIDIKPTPSCVPPTALALSSITSSSANLAWTASVSLPSSYELYYSTTNTAPTASTTPSTTSLTGTSTALSSLTATTTYYVWMRSNCSGAYSDWSSVASFTTLCNAVTAFTQNFDAGTTIPTCFAKVGTTGSVSVQTSSASSTPNCLYFYASSTTDLATFALQPVSNAGAGTHRIRFKARANFTIGGVLQVGFLTNPTDPATFTSIQSFTTTSITVYDNFICNSGTSAGTNQTLAFRHTGSPTNSILIDDIVWEPIPTCNEPTALVISNLTVTGTDLSWTAPTPIPANGYEYYVSTTSTAPTAATVATGTSAASPANISGLTAATTYYVWVRANCGGGDISAWSAVKTFTTLCDAISVVAGTPWLEGFETPVTPVIPNCWAKIDGNADGDAWVTSTTGPRTGLNCARIYTDLNTSNQDYFITPQFILPSTPQRLRFWVKANSATEVDEISVKLATNSGNAIADYTTVLLPSTPVNTTTYVEKIIDLSAYANQTVRIAFVRENTPVDGWYLYLDDVKIENIPTCNEPTALVISNLTATGTDLSWTAPTPIPTNGYEYYVSTTNTAPTAVTTATGTSTASPANLSGLTSATTYYVWVRSNCGGGDISPWSSILSFITECDAITPNGFAQNFDAVTVPALPICWKQLANNSNTLTSSTYTASSGANCLRWGVSSTAAGSYAIAVGPSFNAPINTKQVKFRLTSLSGLGAKIQVGYMTDPNNQATFVLLGETVGIATSGTGSSMTTQIISLINAPSTTGLHLAFKHNLGASDNMYIDDVIFEDLPSVDIATDALVTAGCYSATQTITVRIKNSGLAPIDFSTNPATVTTVVSGAATATLTGTAVGTLAPGATVNIDMSAPVNMSAGGVYNFACSTVTTGDQNASNDALASQSRTAFSNGTITQTVNFTGFTGANLGTAATGWTEAKNTGAAASPAVNSVVDGSWTSSTSITAQGTTAKVNLYSTGKKEWILSPIMSATANSVLTYKVAITDFAAATVDATGMQGTDDEVKAMVSTDCGATWTALQTFNAASTTTLSNIFVGHSHSLAAYAGQNIMIGFYASEGTTDDASDYDFHLDDINIGEVCTGTPTAGTLGGAAIVGMCTGVTPAALVVTGASILGVTYQWEQSLDDGISDPWVSVTGGTGATNTTYTPPAYAGTSIFYHLKVTCTASGLSASTTSVNLTPPAAPTTAASNVIGTVTSLTAATITWTNGNGGRRFVAINTSNTFTDPVGLGDINLIPSPTVYLGTGEQIVYDGTGSSVSVTGLTQGVTYYARVYEYLRCSANNNYYNISTATLNPSAGFKPDAPANDNIANATSLAIGSPCTTAPYTVFLATKETGEPIPSCWGGSPAVLDGSVWFKFTAPASGNDVTVSTDFAVGTLIDSQIGLYGPFNTGATPTMTSLGTAIACDEDGGITGVNGYMSIMTKKGLEPGATYYVQVDRYGSTTTAGTFCIQVSEAASNTAVVAPTVAACTAAPSVSIGSSNNNVWVPIYTSTGALVAAINGNGNTLGVVTANYYTTTTDRTDAQGVHYLGRNFGITVGVQPAVGTPALVRLYYTDAEMTNLQNFDPSASNANVNVTHVPGGSCLTAFNPQGFTPALIAPGASDRLDFGAGAYLQFPTPSFSSFFIHTGSTPLPIELKNLAAKENGKFNTVFWETAIEDNLDYFIVEKSENGLSWSNAGRVYPNTSKRYAFDDKTPFATTYYRLKNVDKDTREATSKSVVVERQIGKFNITSIAPNPTQGDLSVKFETTDNNAVVIHVLDIFGKIVLTQKVDAEKGINTVLVDTSNLPNGAYFISLNNGEKTLLSKMIKQ